MKKRLMELINKERRNEKYENRFSN